MKSYNIIDLKGKALSTSEAIEEAGINWNTTTGKSGVLTYDPHLNVERWKTIPSKKGVYRTDTQEPLGDCIVGKGFELVQNDEAFSTFDKILSESHAEFISGGHFHNGASVFLQCKLPQTQMFQNGDSTHRYLLISQGHTGQQALTMRFTHIRPSCYNTLVAALNDSNYYYSLRHTRNVRQKIEQAVEFMKLGLGHLDKVEKRFNQFTTLRLSELEQLNYMKLCYDRPVDSKLDDLKNWKNIEPIFFDARGKNFSEGTLWHPYNVVTEFEDHHSRVNRPKGSRMNDAEWGQEIHNHRRVRSMFAKGTVARKTKAFTLANDVAEGRLDLKSGKRLAPNTGFAAHVA
jgi:phage/plasmid-like protein (TIGR03299 family)